MLQNSPLYAYIPAKDVARARHSTRTSSASSRSEEWRAAWCTSSARAPPCFLYPTPNAGTSRASQAFWQVDDIEREVAELKKRGVKFEDYDMPGMKTEDGIFTGGGAKAAWFKDSEGNILAVIQKSLDRARRASERCFFQ